jgi:hypothetical protein
LELAKAREAPNCPVVHSVEQAKLAAMVQLINDPFNIVNKNKKV